MKLQKKLLFPAIALVVALSATGVIVFYGNSNDTTDLPAQRVASVQRTTTPVQTNPDNTSVAAPTVSSPPIEPTPVPDLTPTPTPTPDQTKADAAQKLVDFAKSRGWSDNDATSQGYCLNRGVGVVGAMLNEGSTYDEIMARIDSLFISGTPVDGGVQRMRFTNGYACMQSYYVLPN